MNYVVPRGEARRTLAVGVSVALLLGLLAFVVIRRKRTRAPRSTFWRIIRMIAALAGVIAGVRGLLFVFNERRAPVESPRHLRWYILAALVLVAIGALIYFWNTLTLT